MNKGETSLKYRSMRGRVVKKSLPRQRKSWLLSYPARGGRKNAIAAAGTATAARASKALVFEGSRRYQAAANLLKKKIFRAQASTTL